MRTRILRILCLILPWLLLIACGTTRYVSDGEYLLSKNNVEILRQSGDKKEQRALQAKISTDAVSKYIIQRPNTKIFGMNIRLGAYNVTDSSKHNRWHRFWGTKVGQPPVILDSTLTKKSASQMEIYLASVGYLDARVGYEVKTRKKKARVVYQVTPNTLYVIDSVRYNIKDDFLNEILMPDTINSLIKVGRVFDRLVLDAERTRITNLLTNMGFWGFGNNYINYTVDTMGADCKVSVVMNIRQKVVSVNDKGKQTLGNHPIYRIGRIVVNSDYDPTSSIAKQRHTNYDTLVYNGIEILYEKKMYIKPKVLVNALRLSPNEIYEQNTVKRTYSNLRTLSYNPNILFSPQPATDSMSTIYVTLASSKGSNVVTREQELECLVQCTPLMRQNINEELELTTTSDYYSLALKLGYQNRNIFGGAELFNVSFRGAYEFMKNSGNKNSYEFGVSTSIEVPRFWLPISNDVMSRFTQATTRMSLSYNIQNRPSYRRSLFSGTYGYGWTMNNGARFSINPVDINVVDVPWVSESFLQTIDNEFLRNSYRSQLIAGISASYTYNTSVNPKENGFTFRVNADLNGNLLRLIAPIFHRPIYTDNEVYYNLFGLRFAQYARLTAEVSNRINVGNRSQLAWRVTGGAGYAYGNSNTVPFERLFFVGGNNSMRGWQPRTLGPGGTRIDSLPKYPNQLGNIRLEANFEYRVNVVGGLNLALFVDAGNVWSNSRGVNDKASKFNFSTFYKQIALDAGIGLRYDLNFVVIRLDWGWKLHNPNLPAADAWFSQLKIKDTALHFALGLPF